MTPEAIILEAYKNGNNESLAVLVNMYQEKAFWIAWHIVKNEENAKDVVHDAFVKLLRKPSLYDGERAFKAWFFQVVRNLSIDFLRKKKPILENDIVAEYKGSDGFDKIEQNETRDRIEQVLNLMSPKYSELIRMREVDELSLEEIAGIIDVKYATTRWRMSQARKQFKELWIENFGEYDS